jgi:hypothetical protein
LINTHRKSQPSTDHGEEDLDNKSRPLLADAMPLMLRHAGIWQGTYRHIEANGALLETHSARVECVFPTSGPYAYIQHNHFTWDDGREYRASLDAVLRDGKLWWDNDNFRGCGWESDFGLILLNLQRKDDTGANFYEMICMGDDGKHRSRTWHWFKNGKLFKRTLCDEELVAGN